MKEENYIAFENYLSKSLSEEEVLAFEKKLHSGSEFKDSFTTYKELSGFLEYNLQEDLDEPDFKTNLNHIATSYFKRENRKTKPSKFFKLSRLTIAATIALFFGLFLFNKFSAPNYADYSNHNTISLTVRGNLNTVAIKAQNAFNDRKFVTAETYFNELLQENPNTTEIKLYKAISQIEQDKFTTADATLKQIASGQSAYKNDAIWYAALSKLKQKKKQECINLIKKLPEDSIYYAKAQQLIGKLD